MNLFLLLAWAVSAGLQTGVLALAWCVGTSPSDEADEAEAEPVPSSPPLVTLIIPCSGRSPDMEAALHSLLRQDYPALAVLLVTHGVEDPARQLAQTLAARYAHTRHVDAGTAEFCGQKNRNLLDALREAAPATAAYVFCDANHLAKPDFIRRLTEPILLGRETFCSGYRRTRLLAAEPNAVACHILVRHLGLLQSLPAFTQPWGGAFAADAAAFRELNVAALWEKTVVDDVSLAGLLMREGIRVSYRQQAILDSPLRAMSEQQLQDWFFRQLFYPKFYTFAVWITLGISLAWFAAIACADLLLLAVWASGNGLPAATGPLALAHLGLPLVFQERLRRRAAPDCPPPLWRRGLRLALQTLCTAFCRTVFSRGLVWRGIRYRLAANGLVIKVEHPGPKG
ncbi:MAG: glycosyltransferase family 2 protein [Desulfovibrio sp.]|nr:glycosyltransferase family 2 protein [Desulfovibrio sp.]